MRYTKFIGLILLLLAPCGWALDPRADINRAIELLDQRQYSLARTYLGPALISPYISASERSRAYYLRGFSYGAQGLAVSALKDFNRALEFNPGNPAALVELGRLHLAGKGTKKDETVAFGLFQEAADLDYAPGRFHMGYAYLLGQGVDKDIVRARQILAEAAEAGHVFAMISLASSYRAEHIAVPEPELAREWYLKANEAGEPKGLVALGYMHLNGEFGDKDASRAVELFREAAESGVAAANTSLAYAYLTGRGVEADDAKAFELYSLAGEAGDPGSFVGLGHMYEHGIGTPQDRQAAERWYRKAAQRGTVDAQLRLVTFYLAQDSAESRRQALYWCGQAARSGEPQALNDYAWLLATNIQDDLRNGTLAVDQAEKAVALSDKAPYLDTLAAAYAEVGNFEKAVSVQLEALAALAEEVAAGESEGAGALRGELEQRLEYYQRREPWRE